MCCYRNRLRCCCTTYIREREFSVLSVTPGSTTTTFVLDRLIADLPQNGPFKLKVMLNQIPRTNNSNIVFTDLASAGPLPGTIYNANALRCDSLLEYCERHDDCNGIVVINAYRGNDAPTIGKHITLLPHDMCDSSFAAAEVAPPVEMSAAVAKSNAKSKDAA